MIKNDIKNQGAHSAGYHNGLGQAMQNPHVPALQLSRAFKMTSPVEEYELKADAHL